MRKTVLFMLLALIFTACSNEEILRQVIYTIINGILTGEPQQILKYG